MRSRKATSRSPSESAESSAAIVSVRSTERPSTGCVASTPFVPTRISPETGVRSTSCDTCVTQLSSAVPCARIANGRFASPRTASNHAPSRSMIFPLLPYASASVVACSRSGAMPSCPLLARHVCLPSTRTTLAFAQGSASCWASCSRIASRSSEPTATPPTITPGSARVAKACCALAPAPRATATKMSGVRISLRGNRRAERSSRGSLRAMTAIFVRASPSDASLTHTLEQGACRTGLARSLGMTLSTSLDVASVSSVPNRRD